MYNDDIDRNIDETGLNEEYGVFGIYDFDRHLFHAFHRRNLESC